jgi:hypothetical protein
MTDGTGQANRTGNRTGRTEQNRIYIYTGLAERDRQNRAGRNRQAEQERQKGERQNRTGRQDRQTDQAELDQQTGNS